MIPGTYLVYSCNPGYELKGSSDIFCGPKSKWSSEPECVGLYNLFLILFLEVFG